MCVLCYYGVIHPSLCPSASSPPSLAPRVWCVWWLVVGIVGVGVVCPAKRNACSPLPLPPPPPPRTPQSQYTAAGTITSHLLVATQTRQQATNLCRRRRCCAIIFFFPVSAATRTRTRGRFLPYLAQGVRHGLQDAGTRSIVDMQERMCVSARCDAVVGWLVVAGAVVRAGPFSIFFVVVVVAILRAFRVRVPRGPACWCRCWYVGAGDGAWCLVLGAW